MRLFLPRASRRVVTPRLEVSLNSHPRCLSVTPRGIWDKSHGDVLRERRGKHPGSSFTWTDSLSGCLRKLGPGNWSASNQFDSAAAAGVWPTCWGESRRPDEEDIPPGSTIKMGRESAPAPSVRCEILRCCAHFLREETERVMMQL